MKKYSLTFLAMTSMIGNAVMGAQCSATIYSTVAEFPLPDGKNPVSDPDGILSESGRQSLVETIETSFQNLAISCPHESDTTTISGDTDPTTTEQAMPVQVAIAIVNGLNRETAYSDQDLDVLVRNFSTELHNKWGVGQQTQKGGTGVLILLDVSDRAVFISRGGALDKILTDDRLERIISEMRSPLKQAKYDVALAQAVESIVYYVESGEPSNGELVFFICVAGFAIFVAVHEWKKNRDKRGYARVQSQLTEMDQARAEALQGNLQPQTSCSICLETFESNGVGSDGQPVKLLRCGHIFDETCWSEWVSSGRGAVTKCPVCRMDVGSTDHHGIEGASENGQGSTVNDSLSVRESDDIVAEQDQDRTLQIHQQERRFRLARLSALFPHYLTPDQVTRYSSPTYNGDMATDDAFRATDPVRVERRFHQSESFTGFAGGSSSGGVGGRF